MRYRIREVPNGFQLLRNGETVESNGGNPNNCELEFWTHFQAYKKAYEAASRVLWMAEKYSEGDNFDGENYEEAMEDIAAALADIGVKP